MESVRVNPRDIAEALDIDLWELGRLMRKWSANAYKVAGECALKDDSDRERGDEWAEKASRHLDAALACEAAWREDNPDVPIEDE